MGFKNCCGWLVGERRLWRGVLAVGSGSLITVSVVYGFSNLPVQMAIAAFLGLALLFMADFGDLESLAVSVTGIKAAKRQVDQLQADAARVVRDLSKIQARALMETQDATSYTVESMKDRRATAERLLDDAKATPEEREAVEQLWRRMLALLYLSALQRVVERRHAKSSLPIPKMKKWWAILGRISRLPAVEEVVSAADDLKNVPNPPGKAFQ